MFTTLEGRCHLWWCSFFQLIWSQIRTFYQQLQNLKPLFPRGSWAAWYSIQYNPHGADWDPLGFWMSSFPERTLGERALTTEAGLRLQLLFILIFQYYLPTLNPLPISWHFSWPELSHLTQTLILKVWVLWHHAFLIQSCCTCLLLVNMKQRTSK